MTEVLEKAPSRVLTAEDIANAVDIELVRFEVPEWGGCVYLRPLTSGEKASLDFDEARAEVDARGPVIPGKPINPDVDKQRVVFVRQRERMLVKMMCDEQGKPLYSEDQVGALSKKHNAIITRIHEKCCQINYMTGNAVEELAKNSKGAQKEDLNSP